MVEPENTSVLAQKEPQHYDFSPKSLFSTLIGTLIIFILLFKR
jgi:hypothetical protein